MQTLRPMRFVITRPAQDAEGLAEQIAALGHETCLSPVMKLHWLTVAPPEPAQISGLVITSRNALRSLQQEHDLAPYHDLPLFAVGKSCALAAEQAGFTKVFKATERARTLPALIETHLEAHRSAPLYHPGGKKLAFDIAPKLQEMGFSLQRQIVYETKPVNRLSPALVKGLETDRIDGVLLLSPRSARLFGELVNNNGLAHKTSTVACLCLSPNVASAANGLPWRKTLVATHPDMDQLLDQINQLTLR